MELFKTKSNHYSRPYIFSDRTTKATAISSILFKLQEYKQYDSRIKHQLATKSVSIKRNSGEQITYPRLIMTLIS